MKNFNYTFFAEINYLIMLHPHFCFHPELSDVDNSLIYGITGGVPHYINKLDVNKNVDEALLDNLFLQKMYS